MGSESSGSSLLHLQWNSYSTCWHAALSTLRTTGQFCDLTLVVDDGHLTAHRVVVTSCSPLLARALAVCHHPHPALVLRGVNMVQMKGILDFMYMGQTKVEQGALENFLKAAEELCVTGLTGSTDECGEHEEKNVIIEDVILEKSPHKRPNSSLASVSPKSKKPKSDEVKVKKPKQKKPKKEKQKGDENDKSPPQKEGYEETASPPKEPTINTQSGNKSEGTVPEPVIVFKKVFSPDKNASKTERNIPASPKKRKLSDSPRVLSDNGIEEVTVTLTPSKKKGKEDKRSSEPGIGSGKKNLGSPIRRITPGGPGSSKGLPSSPDKFSPNGQSSMTNLPEDRAKLRDIWDTLVAPEDIDGEIVYSCLCCEKTFKGKSAKSNAWSHVDHNHTPHIEHKCHMCDFTSKSNDGVSRHISKTHKKEQAKKDEEEQKGEEEDEEVLIVLD